MSEIDPQTRERLSALWPAEKMALTVALNQLRRGEDPPPNTAAACIFALDRLVNGCPTCSGPTRETAGMVCQTCGTDYGATP